MGLKLNAILTCRERDNHTLVIHCKIIGLCHHCMQNLENRQDIMLSQFPCDWIYMSVYCSIERHSIHAWFYLELNRPCLIPSWAVWGQHIHTHPVCYSEGRSYDMPRKTIDILNNYKHNVLWRIHLIYNVLFFLCVVILLHTKMAMLLFELIFMTFTFNE